MANLSITKRLVVEYEDSAGKAQVWLPKTMEVADETFIEVGYSDRGFARLCEGDVNTSNPLKLFTWLEQARQLRTEKVNVLLDIIATEKNHTHIAGSPLKNKDQLAEFLPPVVTISAPEVTVADVTEGPCEIRVVTEVWQKNTVCVRMHS